MDRALNALVNLDVRADVVRIEVRGSLTQISRPGLVHIIRRVRLMGIRSHIRVGFAQAAMVQSPALAGLRRDLNAIDAAVLSGVHGKGVSLDFAPGSGWPDPAAPDDLVPLLEEGAEGYPGFPSDPAVAPGFPLAALPECALPAGLFQGRKLAEYSDEELLLASDSLFAMLDSPSTFAGADILGSYEDIGQEILRRRQTASMPGPEAKGQAAS